MDGLNSITFAYYTCKNLVVPSAFSTVDMALFKRNSYCFASDILHFDKKWMMEEAATFLEAPQIRALIRRLRSDIKLSELEAKYPSEKLAFLDVVNVLTGFCAEVVLSARTYNNSHLEGITGKVTVKHLGMGIVETWRGSPDSRLRGFPLENDVPLISGHSLPHDERSNGTSTVCESKLEINKKKHLCQLVKTCIVASFVEANLHPELSSMIPAICVDTEKAMVALYCAKKDVLLVSEVFNWRNGGNFNISGISLLFAMINHRYEIQCFNYTYIFEFIL